MKQRLGIGGALLNDPDLLLLDEPANGLDPAGIVAMRDTLRHLASLGKTVFVSSHLLAEVQLMADIVGIIAAGKLVREGPIGELLASQGVVRVRVAPDEVLRAREVLGRLAEPDHVIPNPDGSGWIAIHVGVERSSEINRALAEAGIYASGLSSGSDLEALFLSLTDSASAADPDGTFAAVGRTSSRSTSRANGEEKPA